MKAIHTWKLNTDQLNDQLYRVRAQIIRDELEGVEHVDALLRLRGLEPEAFHIPKKINREYKRGDTMKAVLKQLRNGPERFEKIATHMHKSSVRGALKRLEARGIVVKEGRVWNLAP